MSKKDIPENKMEQVHGHVYNPTSPSIFKAKANTKAEAFEIYCSNKDSCEAFHSGYCLLRITGIFYSGACPYGKNVRITGPTRRAKKFFTWIDNLKDKYKSVGTLKEPENKRLLSIGDYYYMPYSYMTCLNKKSKNLFYKLCDNDGIIKKEHLTVELLKELYNLSPRNMWNNSKITKYQEKIVPKFLNDLATFAPDLFKLLAPYLSKTEIHLNLKVNYVGKKVLLSSINNNVEVIILKKPWFWDGEVLTLEGESCSGILSMEFGVAKSNKVIVTPREDAVITITSNEQCNDSTKII